MHIVRTSLSCDHAHVLQCQVSVVSGLGVLRLNQYAIEVSMSSIGVGYPGLVMNPEKHTWMRINTSGRTGIGGKQTGFTGISIDVALFEVL
ncbi:hypothetical protein G7K_3854-t1 [Saitoella complicata NRRL Y-17804]|uniref:Uncharacterized protein n=1 Tax=Saitoella complicata (strain BCRC 22490 / CBS 7301 / JCM 7358 / NBRC 10748 / NRRL Y-17804) TaxID=698492 RepID=A0A0E9NIN8_SAICN|nr:hypothetical protein G7K_3854-t1 [Saitoella complicata NRRL Y-17804]